MCVSIEESDRVVVENNETDLPSTEYISTHTIFVFSQFHFGANVIRTIQLHEHLYTYTAYNNNFTWRKVGGSCNNFNNDPL